MGRVTKGSGQRTDNSDSRTRRRKKVFGNQAQRKKSVGQGIERKVERFGAKTKRIARR